MREGVAMTICGKAGLTSLIDHGNHAVWAGQVELKIRRTTKMARISHGEMV